MNQRSRDILPNKEYLTQTLKTQHYKMFTLLFGF